MSIVRIREIVGAGRARTGRLFAGGRYSGRDVWRIVHPIVIDTAFLTIVDFVSIGIISSNGPAAIAAVNTGESIQWFMVGTLNAVALGTTVLVARYFGVDEFGSVKKTGAAALQAMLTLSVAYAAIVFVFAGPIVDGLFPAAAQDVKAGVHTYLLGLLISYPARAVWICVAGMLRGVGRTNMSLVLSLSANGSNVVLGFVFVLPMEMGIGGLSLALIVSQLIGLGASIVLLRASGPVLRPSSRMLLRPRVRGALRVLTVSLPFILEDAFFNGGKLIIQTFIVSFGTLQIAASAIIGSWAHIPEIVPRALSIAIVPIVASSLSRRDIAYTRKVTRAFILAGSLTALVTVLLLIPLYPFALDYYFQAPVDLQPVLWQLFLIVGIGYPLLFTGQAVLPSVLRAAGDGFYATGTALASMWIYRICFGYLVSITLGFGVVGLWCVWVSEWGVRYLLFYLRYRTNRWLRHRLT